MRAAAATLDQQIAAMQAAYPLMRLTAVGRWGCIWVGPLRGFDRPYQVRITHVDMPTLGGCDLTWRGMLPRAQVLAPDLLAECGGWPPHLYGAHPHPDLCLFDPDTGEWRPDMLLAESYVPWAAQWLAFYELWRVTGQWTGPERHPEPAKGPAPGAAMESRAPAVPTPAQVHRVAREARTEASEPLLRASAGRRVPSLLLDWR